MNPSSSFIPYYGGKQRMAGKIVPFIPPHIVYVEPFCGGASVFFAKPRNDSSQYQEVLNDVNRNLVNLYLECRGDPNGLMRDLQGVPYSAEVYSHLKNKRGNSRVRAVRDFVGYTQAHANLYFGGFARRVVGTNPARDYWSRTERVETAGLRLRYTTLECEDVLSVIRRWDSPQTFFYCDPPYFQTDLGHMGAWTASNQKIFADAMNSCVGSWIVSGYDFSNNILKYEKSIKFSSVCYASGSGRVGASRELSSRQKLKMNSRTERLFMRGPTRPVRSSLIPVLEKQTCFTGPLLGPCPLPLKTHPSAQKAAALSK